MCFPGGSAVKNLPAVQEIRVCSLGWEDLLEEGMATHSSILAWRIPMDRVAWQATVHGVTKSRARLKWLSTCIHTHTHTHSIYIFIYIYKDTHTTESLYTWKQHSTMNIYISIKIFEKPKPKKMLCTLGQSDLVLVPNGLHKVWKMQFYSSLNKAQE